MNTLITKGLLILLSLLSVFGGIWYTKNLVQDNAVLQATIDSTATVLANYATSVEQEVSTYASKNTELTLKYQIARDAKNKAVKDLMRYDLEKIAKEHPTKLEHSINAGTARLFDELEAATRSNPSKSGRDASID